MSLWELVVLSVGLAMDAFAVSVCKGLSIQKLKTSQALTVGLWFGAFQALMPLAGWLLGRALADLIEAVDHWVAFALLAAIGGKMLWEAFSGESEGCDASLSFGVMLTLAVATSIDALAVGITFAVIKVDIVPAVSLIGAVTFALSALGVKIGNLFGARFKGRAEALGGAVLILIGLKILLEHLGII